MGCDVLVGSNHRSTLVNSHTLELPFADPQTSAQKITCLAKTRHIAAIFGVEETTSHIAALACAALGLPGNPPASIATLHDKLLFRRFLSSAGMRCPRYRPINTQAPSTPVVDYPWVIKPRALSASRGVIRVDTEASFAAAAKRIRRLTKNNDEPVALAETYVPGSEVTLEGLLVDGELHTLALFDKPDTPAGPAFPETLYIAPSRLPDTLQNICHRQVQSLARSLGLTSGPLHAELRLNRHGCWLIDVAARPIGGLCGNMLRFRDGRSHESLILRQQLGHLPLETVREARAIGVLMLPIEKSGMLSKVDGITTAQKIDGVEEVRITVPYGERVEPLPWGDPYLGFVFARASTPQGVETALRAARQMLSPLIVP